MNGYNNGLIQGMAWMLEYILDRLPLSEKERKHARNRGIQEVLRTKGYGKEASEELIIKYLGVEK